MVSSPEKQYRLEELMPLLRQRLAEGSSVCIGPKGTSMLPLIRQGIDYVELSPLPERLKKYDIPLYQRDNGQYVLHRIVKVGDTYTCIGDNQFDLETGVRHEQLIAVTTAVYRGEKRYALNTFRYWLYCRYWHHSRPFRKQWLRAKGALRRLLIKA